MQRRTFFLPALIVLGSTLALPALSFAQGNQGAPDPKRIMAAAKKSQADLFKTKYGFSDAQTAMYQAQEAKIFAQWQQNLGSLQNQMIATKDKEQKRKLMVKMRDSIKTRDAKVQAALRAVATPAQRAKLPGPI